MAERGLAKVALSVTTLDRKLARAMEPRAATPPKRLETMAKLAAAGIPVTVMVAPMIPALNDMEIERMLEAGYEAGAREAGYVLLRLPLEVAPIFREWLIANYPDRYTHVMSVIRRCAAARTTNWNGACASAGAGPMPGRSAAASRWRQSGSASTSSGGSSAPTSSRRRCRSGDS